MTITNCTVSGNSAVNGGGIANQGTLNVSSSSHHQQPGDVPGWWHQHDRWQRDDHRFRHQQEPGQVSGTAQGGGIFSANTLLSLTGCTVNGNQANGASALGGGISAYSSVLSLTNCTVNANQANGATAYGGGIYALYSSVDRQQLHGGGQPGEWHRDRRGRWDLRH